MRNSIFTAVAALSMTLGAAAPGAAAVLDLPTGAPSVEASGSADFIFGELSFLSDSVDATSGASVATADDVNGFLGDPAFGLFGNLGIFDGTTSLLTGETVLATGFSDTTIEVLFGGFTGTAAGDLPTDNVLLTLTFDDPLGTGRTSVFDGLVDGENYGVALSAAAVVPLPAPILLLGAGILALGGLRAAGRRRA
ncbi:MAG: hypothetical protein AAGG09_06805 [Pseudomonadota bacterium]